MDIQEFNRRILQKQEQLKDLVRRKMPVIVGNIAKRHIEDDFRKGGFTHNGFHKWQETERQKNGGKGTDSRYGSLLSGRNHLSGSIEYALDNGTVTVFTRYTQSGWYGTNYRHSKNATLCLDYVLQSHRYQTENETWWESS